MVAASVSIRAQDEPAQSIPKMSLGRGLCIDLTGHGLKRSKQLDALIAAAIEDSGPGVDMGRFGFRPLSFYKARYASGSDSLYLVFEIRGFDDVYMVYVANLQQDRLIGRSAYGSLHYPCPQSPKRAEGV